MTSVASPSASALPLPLTAISAIQAASAADSSPVVSIKVESSKRALESESDEASAKRVCLPASATAAASAAEPASNSAPVTAASSPAPTLETISANSSISQQVELGTDPEPELGSNDGPHDESTDEEEEQESSNAEAPAQNNPTSQPTDGAAAAEFSQSQPAFSVAATLICSVCQKHFFDGSALRKHAKIHSARQFLCLAPGCGRRFIDNSKLKRHQLVHTGERKFVCQHVGCGKKFALDFNLRSHTRVHTGEKPFTCQIASCARRFAQISNLKAHYKTHQNGKADQQNAKISSREAQRPNQNQNQFTANATQSDPKVATVAAQVSSKFNHSNMIPVVANTLASSVSAQNALAAMSNQKLNSIAAQSAFNPLQMFAAQNPMNNAAAAAAMGMKQFSMGVNPMYFNGPNGFLPYQNVGMQINPGMQLGSGPSFNPAIPSVPLDFSLAAQHRLFQSQLMQMPQSQFQQNLNAANSCIMQMAQQQQHQQQQQQQQQQRFH